MTAADIAPTATPTLADERRPSLGRMTLVELRKMINTRAGFWLPVAVAVITLITVVVSMLVSSGRDATLTQAFHNSVQPDAFLLPVLGILLVCGEWSQRTTLTTFTLVPDRGRVLAAKLAASFALAVGAFVICLACSVVFAELLSNAPGGAGGLSLAVLGQGLLFLAAAMVMGIAFGAAILVSAPAIVAYLLLPTVWDALASSIHALATLDRWLDIGTTLGPLAQRSLSASDWAHVGTTLALWTALPLVIGWWRFRHRDVS